MFHRLLDGLVRLGTELASTLIWLASGAGGYVTGQTVVVDRGVTIN
jgi:NAD(P)-dependent dehydrogenase (short-subunit alcohol dehydrogenase family)